MKKTLFLTAALSSAFVSYQLVKQQELTRTPSSFSSPLTIMQQPPVATAAPQQLQIYSYQDIVNTYNTALSNETTMRQGVLRLQSMLAQARQTHSIERASDFRRSPYGTTQTTIRTIESDLRMLQTLRRNNLAQAYRQIHGTYAMIQLPPTDGSPGLTRAHHVDAVARLNHIAAITQYVSTEGNNYFAYPESMQPYLVAANSSLPPEVVNPVTATATTAAPAVPAPQVAIPVVVEAPQAPAATTSPINPNGDAIQEVVTPVFTETPVAM